MITQAIQVPFADAANPALSWALAGAAVVIVGIAKSGFGSGVGIVAVPMFVFAFAPGRSGEAMGALLPLLIAADVLSVYHHRGTWDTKNLRVLAPGTLVGIALGAALMWWLLGRPNLGWSLTPRHIDKSSLEATGSHLQVAIGVICLAYVFGDQVKQRFAPAFWFIANYRSGSAFGLVAGVVTTIAHAAGPVVTIFLLGQHLAKQKFIGTAVIYFFAVNVFKQLTVYPALGLTDTDSLWLGLWLLPLVPVGTFLGLWLHKRMSERVFRIVILTIVFLSGLKLVWPV